MTFSLRISEIKLLPANNSYNLAKTRMQMRFTGMLSYPHTGHERRQKEGMIAFFYGDFIYFFVGVVSIGAGYGLSLFYQGRQLLHDARANGEQLSRQAQRLMRIGMSMFLTLLILLVLFSVVGIIFHKLVVVVSLLMASIIGTFLAAALFSRALKGK